MIIPELKVGIVDGTAPHVLEPKAPGAIEEYVNLGAGWDARKLAQHRDEIVQLNEKIERCYQSAYNAFAAALRIHDEWERFYIENMNFAKANELKDECIETFFAERKLDKKAVVRHRYLGAATPNGAIDFIPNLTADVPKRYFLKGRPGSGKIDFAQTNRSERGITRIGCRSLPLRI